MPFPARDPSPAPRSSALLLLVCAPVVLALLFAVAAPGRSARAQDGRPGDTPRRLGLDDYIAALETIEEGDGEADGLAVHVAVIPDLCHYLAVRKYQKLKESGFNSQEIEDRLRKEVRKLKKERGKPLLRIALTAGGRQRHYFLQYSLAKHVTLQQRRKVSCRVKAATPKPIYASWKIYELNNKRDFKKKLAYLKELRFDVAPSARLKKGDKTPLVLTVKDLLRYQEVKKRNPYERIGINVAVKQLALSNVAELSLPEISITLHPGKWKLPRPSQELEEMLERLGLGS